MIVIIVLTASAGVGALVDAATAQVALDRATGDEAAPRPMYSVVPLRFEIASDDVIGRRKSGMLCLPAGSIRWRDAAPDPSHAANRLARALHSSGVDVSVSDDNWLDDEPSHGKLRLVVAVKRAALNACNPQWGPVKLVSRTLKGDGSAEIAWRVYDTSSRKQIAAGSVCKSFRFSSKQLTMPNAMMEGLAGIAEEISNSLRRATPPQKVADRKGDKDNSSIAPICDQI